MSDLNLAIKIAVDASQAQQEIVKARKLLEELFKTTSNVEAKKNIQASIIQFKALEEELKTVSSNAKNVAKDITGLGKAFDNISNFASIESLKNIATSLENIGNKAKSLGMDFINEAKEVGGYERQIKNLSQSTEQATKALQDVKSFTEQSKIWDAKSVTSVGAEIVKFGLDVKEVLPLIAQFAESRNVDIVQPTETIVKSLAGVRGGLMQLSSQYGITKEILASYGAEMTQSGEVEKDSLKTKEAIIKALNASHGSFSTAKLATMEYNKSMSELKESIGKELIPYMTALSLKTAEIVRYFESWDDATKKLVISGTAATVGVLAVGGAVAGAGVYVLSLVASMGNLVMAVTGATTASAGLAVIWSGISGTFGVVVGAIEAVAVAVSTFTLGIIAAVTAGAALIKWTNDYKIAIEQLPQKDLQTAIENQSKAMEKLKADFPGVISAQEAYNQAKQKGFDNILKDINGQQKLKDLVKGLTTEELLAQEKKERALDDEAKAREKLNSIAADDPQRELYENQVRMQEQVVKNEQNIINSIIGEKQAIYAATDAYKEKANASKAPGTGAAIDDTAFNEEIKRQDLLTETKKQNLDTQILNFRNFRTQYTLTEMQGLEIEKQIGDAQEQINKNKISSDKTVFEEENKNWRTFQHTQERALKDGLISQKQYNQNILKYLQDNSVYLEKNTDLKTIIEKKYYDGVDTLRASDAKKWQDKLNKETKALEEAKEKQKQAILKLGQELLAQEEKDKKIREEFQKTSLISSGKPSGEYQSRMIDLDKERKEYEKAGISKHDIDKWYFEEKGKLTKDYYDSLMSKEQAAQDKQFAGYNQSLSVIEALNAIKVAEGSITQAQADRAKADFIGLEVNKNKEILETLREKVNLYGASSLTSAEASMLQFLSNQLITYKEINTELKKGVDTTSTISIGMDKVTTSTNKATEATGKLNQQLQETAAKMETIGNLSAKTTGNETGNFMSVDEAFSGLPGTGDYNASTEKSNSWFSKYMDRTAGTEKTGSTRNYDDMWRKMVAIQQAYEAGDKGNSSVGIKKGDFSVYNSYLKKYTELYGHDNPSNDKRAEELGMKLSLKAIDKNFLDISKYIMQGSVKGINMTLAKLPNTTNINNSKQQSSSSQQTVNKYYFEGSEISGNSSLKRDLNRVALNINSRYGQRSGRL